MGCTVTQRCNADVTLNPTTLSMLDKPFPPQPGSQTRLDYFAAQQHHTVPSQRTHKHELWALCTIDIPEPWRSDVIEKLKQVQALYNMKNGWYVKSKMRVERDINWQTRPAEDSEWDIVRSDCLINESGLATLSVLMNYRLREYYDSMWEIGSVLDSLGKDTRITYLRTRRKMFIVRDMVHLTHDIFLRDETIISLSFSISTKQCPPQRGVIRSHLYFQCWILKPIRDTDNASLHKTHVTLITHIDPKGTIGQLGKQHFCNVFGVKPLQNLRSYIHKQTTSKGYRRIRYSMYNFFASNSRDETIHDVSDDESSDNLTGIYSKVKNLNANLDRDPITMFIDERLRNHQRGQPVAKHKIANPEVGETAVEKVPEQKHVEHIIIPDQQSLSVAEDETSPDVNVSWIVNEKSLSAGKSSNV